MLISTEQPFARRRTTNGETPWGQNYAIAAIKETIVLNGANKEVTRAVIFETGTSLLSRLKRAGYEDTAEAKLGLKRTVAAKAVDKHQLFAGFVAASSFTASGAMAGFTKDLTNWIGPSAPTEALVVVLIGFPDLESDDDGGSNDDDDFPYASCDVQDGIVGNNRTCDAGRIEVFSWPVCDGNYGRVYPTDAGTITVGEGYFENGVNANYAGTCMERNPDNRFPPCNTSAIGATNYALRIPYTMNNVVVVTSTCKTYTYRETQPLPGWTYPIWPYEQFPYGAAQGWKHRVCCTPK